MFTRHATIISLIILSNLHTSSSFSPKNIINQNNTSDVSSLWGLVLLRNLL